MAPYVRGIGAHFMEPLLLNKNSPCYIDNIDSTLTLPKIIEKIENHSYGSLTGVVRDFRIMLENFMRYYGPEHPMTRKATKFDTMMEQKLALLNK